MKILAVDTGSTSCSVAVMDKTSLQTEMTLVRKETHSKHLMDMIHAVVTFSGLNISDLDGFAVTTGPGSFTGLRIGISTVKGLATALEKPLVGVSSLETLAMQASCFPYLICSLIDARRGEVYFSRYRFLDGRLEKEVEEGVVPPEKAVNGIHEACIFVGNGALLYKKIISDMMGESAFFVPTPQNIIRASTVACLSINRFRDDNTGGMDSVVPNYIRKSDAELKLSVKNS